MRLFIGIEVKPIVHKISDIQNIIYPYYNGNVVSLDKLNVTLNFLGKMNPRRAAKKLDAVKYHSFEATTNGLGVFPNISQPKVVWIGLKPEGNFIELHKLTNQALGKKFIRYHPHLTLGRIKEVTEKQQFVEQLNNKQIEMKFIVEKFTLFSSQLTPLGHIYNKLKDYPLRTQ